MAGVFGGPGSAAPGSAATATAPFQGGTPKDKDIDLVAAEQRALLVLEKAVESDCLSRLVNSCFDKCVKRFKDPQLHQGETMCIDRCIFKYLQSQSLSNFRTNQFQRQQDEELQLVQHQLAQQMKQRM